ncbi:hypothetical protein Aperf_G00000123470 [Anoplocephala perfoliata]
MSLTHEILPINESSGFDLEPVNKTVIPLTPPRRGKSVSDLPVELGKSTATLRHAPRFRSTILEVLQSPRPVLYQMIRESVEKSPRSSNKTIECTNSGSFDSAQTDSDFMQDLDSSRKPEDIEPVSAESFDTAQLTMNHNNPKNIDLKEDKRYFVNPSIPQQGHVINGEHPQSVPSVVKYQRQFRSQAEWNTTGANATNLLNRYWLSPDALPSGHPYTLNAPHLLQNEYFGICSHSPQSQHLPVNNGQGGTISHFMPGSVSSFPSPDVEPVQYGLCSPQTYPDCTTSGCWCHPQCTSAQFHQSGDATTSHAYPTPPNLNYPSTQGHY